MCEAHHRPGKQASKDAHGSLKMPGFWLRKAMVVSARWLRALWLCSRTARYD